MNEFDAYRAGPSRDTLQALLEAQGQAAYNVCFQVLKEGSQAEDAAQQVLLDLVKQIPRLTDASHLKAWVSRAAFHAALDLKKKERRRTAHERRTAEMPDAPTLTPDQVEAVHAEIARLEDDLRTIVVEHYFEKRPLKDLASEQAVSEVAVWKRLQKAKERLRQSLAATGFSAALLGLDSLLEALEPVRAPKGLVGPGLMAQAAPLLTGAAPLVLAGGLAVKTKLVGIVALIAIALVATVAVGVHRRRERREEERAAAAAAGRRTEPAARTVAARPPAAAPPPAALPEERVRFTSFLAYYEALMKASYIVDTPERARAFRRLGIPVTDEEMAALSKGFLFRPGTEEFAKYLLNELDKVARRIDPKPTLDQARGFTDIDDKTRLRILRRALHEWSRKDLAAAKAYAQTLTEQEGRSLILMEMEPRSTPEGFAQLLALPEGPERSAALTSAVIDMTRADPAAALKRIEALPRGPDRRDALRAMVGQWSRMDFAAALAWVEKDPKRKEEHLLYVISAGADSNPEAAIQAAIKHADPKRGPDNVAILLPLMEIAKKDGAAAARLMDQMSTMLGRKGLIVQEVAPRWGAQDPVEALVWAQQQPKDDQAEIINAVLKGWVKSPKGNLDEARAMTAHLPEEMRVKALETVVVAWSEFEPSAAAAFALREVPSTMTEVVARWFLRNDAAADAWARALSDPELRDRAFVGMSRVQQPNIARSIQAAEEIRNPALRDQTLGKLASSAAKTNFDQSLEILRKVGDPAVRDSSLSLTVALISREQPRQAMTALELFTDPAKKAAAVDQFLSWASQTDPQAAREVMGRMPKVEAIQYQKVAGGMAMKDPSGTAAWALTLPEKQIDLNYVDRKTEEETRPREQALNAVMNTWGASDPDAAARWIKQTSLPESQKSSLLEVVKFQRDHRNR